MTTKLSNYLLIAFTFLFISFGFNPISILATEKSSLGFTVEPIFPNNQIDKELGYYNLLVTPNNEQELSVKVSNISSEPIVINFDVTNSYTNRYGKIDYGPGNPDATLKLTNMVTIEEKDKRIVLNVKEENIVTFKVKPPKEDFSGIVLGALTFTQENKVDSEDTFGYRIGLLLNEDGNTFTQEKELRLEKTEIGWDSGFPSFVIELSNPTQYVTENLDISVKLKKENESKWLEEHHLKSANLAPNSIFKFYIPWNFEMVGVGNYDVEITASINEKDWIWEDSIIVKKADLDMVSKIPNITEESKQPAVFIFLSSIVLIINIILYFFSASKYFNNKKSKKGI